MGEGYTGILYYFCKFSVCLKLFQNKKMKSFRKAVGFHWKMLVIQVKYLSLLSSLSELHHWETRQSLRGSVFFIKVFPITNERMRAPPFHKLEGVNGCRQHHQWLLPSQQEGQGTVWKCTTTYECGFGKKRKKKSNVNMMKV